MTKARSALLLSLLLLLIPAGRSSAGPLQAPQVQSGRWVQSNLDDWIQGTFRNTYVEGDAIRLQPNKSSGEFDSSRYQTPFGFNGAVVETVAHATASQTVTVELRGSLDGEHWGPWQPADRAAQANGRAISQFFAFRAFTSWLQYRALFGSTKDSARLNEVAVTFLSTTAGPALVDLVARTPLPGPSTETAPPEGIPYTDWASAPPDSGSERQTPRRVEIDQLRVPADDPNSAATLRALQWVAMNRYGQSGLPFHYVLNAQGTIMEVATSASIHLHDAERGVVRIAVLADTTHEGLSEATSASLTSLLAWLSEAYHISPQAIGTATDAPAQLQHAIETIRPTIDRLIVRWRRFFPEGSPGNGAERLVLFNDEDREAHASLTGYTNSGQQRRSLTVPPHKRLDVNINTTFPQVDAIGLQVTADHPLYAERTQIVNHEIQLSGGEPEATRAWYFADGDTTDATRSYLLVVNPLSIPADAEITFYTDTTVPVTKTIRFNPRARTTVLLNDLYPNRRFSFKLIASQPIVVERSVFTGTGAASLSGGTTVLSRRWLFAEGTTTGSYSTTLHVLNPWSQVIALTIQVLSEDGTTVSRRYALSPQSSLIVPINDIAPDVPFALDVQGERPLAIEREMRFGDGKGMTVGAGASAPQTRWVFPEGSTAAPAEEFILLANPNHIPATVDIAYILTNGQVRHRQRTAPATGRLTVSASSDVPDQSVLSTIVTSDHPVVAERSIYIHANTGTGGEATLGIGGP